jgi:fibronectin-binding autotransporter adhesin
MKLQLNSCRPFAFAALAALALAGESLHAQTTHTWLFTAPGNTYNWNDPNSWTPSEGFPNSPGAIANVNIDISGDQTIRLQEPIVVGTLTLGDADGSHRFTIASAVGTDSLTFNSGVVNVPAELNLGNNGKLQQTISAPVELNSNLRVNVGGIDATNAQRITFTGAFDTNDNSTTFVGGVLGETQITFGAGVLIGGANAVITNNSHGAMVFNGAHSNFAGKIVVNNSASGSNVSGLTIANNGSLASAGEFEINGYLSAGITQNGGTAWVGNGSTIANPGQRLTENTITFRGGTLHAGGQPLLAAELNREVRDDVNLFRVNSGYSLLTIASSNNTSNPVTNSTRVLSVDSMERQPGASLFVRASQFGNPSSTFATTFLIGNGDDYLYGANGGDGTTTKSIIPWIVAANANASAQSSTTFATYDEVNGLRALTTAELAGTITAGEGHNVQTNNINVPAISSSVTVNSLAFTLGTGNGSDIGSGKTLIVASGAVSFSNVSGIIGRSGLATAGTLQFGLDNEDTEAVIWANGTNQNTIGASITGSGGLTKAGTGTLILTGLTNTFSGMTYVGGGTLQVGSGFDFSTLGQSEGAVVASGAQLSLAGGDMILDTAFIQLEQYGLFNGKVTLLQDVNETIGALYFGETAMPAGTYGAVGSGAGFESDTWFSGTGMLTVVPEPGSAALLLGGFGMMLVRRRRRA